jgi:hypothetical protein
MALSRQQPFTIMVELRGDGRKGGFFRVSAMHQGLRSGASGACGAEEACEALLLA